MSKLAGEMSEELLKAYRQALYFVETPKGQILLKVGERSPDLIDLIQQQNCDNWAYITAANPKSEILSEEENRLRNTELETLLSKDRYAFFKGVAKSPEDSFPAENSFLVFGISEKEAVKLAEKFNQAALLLGTSTGIPVLRFIHPF
jgi:hypothetical protein